MNDFLNKKIIEVRQPKDSYFILTMLLNNFCNNSCDYCPSYLRNGKSHYYDFKDIKKFLDVLFQKHQKIQCSISGGEPTLNPFFIEIIKTFHYNNHMVGVTTNGVKSIDFWKKNSQFLSYIVFSFHPESKFNSNFIEKVKTASVNSNVAIRFMMLPHKWDDCVKQYYDFLKIKNITCEPVKIMNWEDTGKVFIEYNDEQNNWFKKNKKTGEFDSNKNNIFEKIEYIFEDNKTLDSFSIDTNHFINNNMTNFYGYECEVGLKSLFLDWNGDIFLSNCGINPSIGNIMDIKNIKWPKNKVICNKSKCHCVTDVNINKKKINHFIKIF